MVWTVLCLLVLVLVIIGGLEASSRQSRDSLSSSKHALSTVRSALYRRGCCSNAREAIMSSRLKTWARAWVHPERRLDCGHQVTFVKVIKTDWPRLPGKDPWLLIDCGHFEQVDVDVGTSIADKFAVQAMPTFVFFYAVPWVKSLIDLDVQVPRNCGRRWSNGCERINQHGSREWTWWIVYHCS